mgnify:CR=1 FL=1
MPNLNQSADVNENTIDTESPRIENLIYIDEGQLQAIQ